MICQKCNAKLKNGSKYCPKCGEVFKSNDVNYYSELFNAKLLEIYYPNKDVKLKIWGISFLYMIFTYFYAICKRMYLCALYSIISLLFLIHFIPRFMTIVLDSWGFYFFAIFFLIIGFIVVYIYYVINFDKLLLERRKNRINYFIRTNYKESEKYIEELVIKDSKNNIKGLIISILLTLLFIIYKLFLS